MDIRYPAIIELQEEGGFTVVSVHLRIWHAAWKHHGLLPRGLKILTTGPASSSWTALQAHLENGWCCRLSKQN
jgi:hypothetical protein